MTSFFTEEPVPFSLEVAQERHRNIFSVQAPAAATVSGPGKFKAYRMAASVLRDQVRSSDDEVAAPYVIPKTPFDRALGPDRNYAIQAFPLARLQELRKSMGATINDLVLACCAAGLRRYLLEINALPEGPLVTSIAVALEREEGSQGEGNEVAGLYVALPTHLESSR